MSALGASRDPTGVAAAASQRNIELKARDADPARSLAVCRRIEATAGGLLEQRDTYFEVQYGRLKLREHASGPAQLIFYRRTDVGTARSSDYRITEVGDAAEARQLLDEALGTLAVVRKRRRLFLWRGVRIHLDDVEALGRFVELEGVVAEGRTDAEMRARVEQLSRQLEIDVASLVSGSYLDLMTK